MQAQSHHNDGHADRIKAQDLGPVAGPDQGKHAVMNQAHEHAAESVATVAAKLAPPATVSIATVAGYHVSEIVLWLTAIYTLLMILRTIYQFCRDLREKK